LETGAPFGEAEADWVVIVKCNYQLVMFSLEDYITFLYSHIILQMFNVLLRGSTKVLSHEDA
jgi:hypothetical protein